MPAQAQEIILVGDALDRLGCARISLSEYPLIDQDVSWMPEVGRSNKAAFVLFGMSSFFESPLKSMELLKTNLKRIEKLKLVKPRGYHIAVFPPRYNLIGQAARNGKYYQKKYTSVYVKLNFADGSCVTTLIPKPKDFN